MTRTFGSAKRAGLAGFTGLAALALLAGCGQAPTTGSTASGTASGTASAAANPDFLPCVVSDEGGFDDRSFNEQALNGVKAVAEKLGDAEQFKSVQSRTPNDYASNLTNLVRQDCNVIVAAGFKLVAAVKESAADNAETNYVIIDDNSIEADNVKSVVFETDEAAFLAGYASAAYSKTGTVATWGGLPIPSVTIFMDGVADGVAYYNKQKNADVKLLGWDKAKQDGTFVGGFTDQNKARTITQNFLDSGVGHRQQYRVRSSSRPRPYGVCAARDCRWVSRSVRDHLSAGPDLRQRHGPHAGIEPPRERLGLVHRTPGHRDLVSGAGPSAAQCLGQGAGAENRDSHRVLLRVVDPALR